MTDESIYNMDLNDAQEPTCVEPGEYKVRCTGFRKDKESNTVRTFNKDGYDMPYVLVMLDIPNEPSSKDFTHFLALPSTEEGAMTPKDLNACKWRVREFLTAFKMDELNFSRFQGAESYAILDIKSDPEYDDQNIVKRFISGA